MRWAAKKTMRFFLEIKEDFFLQQTYCGRGYEMSQPVMNGGYYYSPSGTPYTYQVKLLREKEEDNFFYSLSQSEWGCHVHLRDRPASAQPPPTTSWQGKAFFWPWPWCWWQCWRWIWGFIIVQLYLYHFIFQAGAHSGHSTPSHFPLIYGQGEQFCQFLLDRNIFTNIFQCWLIGLVEKIASEQQQYLLMFFTNVCNVY